MAVLYRLSVTVCYDTGQEGMTQVTWTAVSGLGAGVFPAEPKKFKWNNKIMFVF